jgi:tetratricopeptide (TPR) repeat protein
MSCPRCGQADVHTPACPQCGVILAKVRAPRARPSPAPAASRSGAASSAARGGILATIVGLVVVGGFFVARRAPTPAEPAAAPPASATPMPETVDLPPSLATIVPSPPPAAAFHPATSVLPDADAQTLVLLAGRLQVRARISDPDLLAGEALLRRQPGEPAAKALLEALLVAVAAQDRAERQPEKAARRFRRVIELRPDAIPPRAGLVAVLLEASDWTGAEAAARDLLSRDPRHPEALRALGFALMRQDRNREAQEALRASLEGLEDPSTRALFERVQKAQTDERGMTEQHLAHFNVRYDGGSHEEVGREILRALERHFATLARTFDHQPGTTVPVVLFAQQSFFDATGAPFWSGGQYSHFDGRITIPIGGLTSALTPTLDDVLIHELTHAFVADLSRGVAPRDVQEGLAQYVEGKRVETELGPAGLQALSEGRLTEVWQFYYAALAFMEQLEAERGQGGINEMLRVMGETGSVDEGFRRVYGRDHTQAAQASADRIRLQHAR